MPKIAVTVTVQQNLVDEVDRLMKTHGRSRSWFFEQAILSLLASPNINPGALDTPDSTELDQRVEAAIARVLGLPVRSIRRAQAIAASSTLKMLGIPGWNPHEADEPVHAATEAVDAALGADTTPTTSTARGRRPASTETN